MHARSPAGHTPVREGMPLPPQVPPLPSQLQVAPRTQRLPSLNHWGGGVGGKGVLCIFLEGYLLFHMCPPAAAAYTHPALPRPALQDPVAMNWLQDPVAINRVILPRPALPPAPAPREQLHPNLTWLARALFFLGFSFVSLVLVATYVSGRRQERRPTLPTLGVEKGAGAGWPRLLAPCQQGRIVSCTKAAVV